MQRRGKKTEQKERAGQRTARVRRVKDIKSVGKDGEKMGEGRREEKGWERQKEKEQKWEHMREMYIGGRNRQTEDRKNGGAQRDRNTDTDTQVGQEKITESLQGKPQPR